MDGGNHCNQDLNLNAITLPSQRQVHKKHAIKIIPPKEQQYLEICAIKNSKAQ